jgi:radical SAM superfamily enzyme YgiQ (UPF0313 family)
MRIVLILPHDSTYRYKTGTFKRSLRYPPLTLTILAALVPPELNAEIQIVDEGVESLKGDFQADLVGISALTATAPRAYALADEIRQRGIPVVLGGIHPTVLPNEAIQHADSVVIGFAEESWPRLLRDFAQGKLERFYISSAPISLANLPFPRRDLLKRRAYVTMNTIMATRGCPNRCSFCSIPIARQGHYYLRPYEDVVEEIKQMEGRRFIFLDPNPTENVRYITKLYQALIPLDIKWVGLSCTKIARNKELLDLAARSGCFGLLLGFETVSQDALVQSNKSFNRVTEYRDIVNELHDRGISVLGCFIFGFDTDDETVFERTLEFIDQAGIDLLRYTIFTPFPGTPVYNDLNREGRIIEPNWQYYDYEHVVFRPSRIDPEKLQERVAWIWRETYSLKSIMKRMARTELTKWENLVYNLGFRHHALELNRAIRARLEGDGQGVGANRKGDVE